MLEVTRRRPRPGPDTAQAVAPVPFVVMTFLGAGQHGCYLPGPARLPRRPEPASPAAEQPHACSWPSSRWSAAECGDHGETCRRSWTAGARDNLYQGSPRAPFSTKAIGIVNNPLMSMTPRYSSSLSARRFTRRGFL